VYQLPEDAGGGRGGSADAAAELSAAEGVAEEWSFSHFLPADAARSRAFWLLAGTFFVCGWTTNGIISTHFVPAAHDHGISPTTAASLLAVVGLFDIMGSLGAGWLTDRVDPRMLLFVYYLLRGVALAMTPLVLGPDVVPPLLVVMMLFGLDWVATVPPTAALCREVFGIERGAVVFGWVFASHMIGAAASAAVSGVMRDALGSYTTAWVTAAVLAGAAALAALLIPRSPVAVPTSTGTPVSSPR
jgi:predicted MFS family arabinose efflux permease